MHNKTFVLVSFFLIFATTQHYCNAQTPNATATTTNAPSQGDVFVEGSTVTISATAEIKNQEEWKWIEGTVSVCVSPVLTDSGGVCLSS
jgi:hypothetical protein